MQTRMQPFPPVEPRPSLVQYLFLLPLWLAFLWGWYLILSRAPRADLLVSLRLIAVIVSLYAITITLWIRHNVRIHRRKGPRRQVRKVTAKLSHDLLGRRLIVADPGVQRNSHIVVEVLDTRKIYRSAAAEGEVR